MKLPKDTRKELREAALKHEPLSIEWPASAPECEIGRKYPLSSFAPDARLRVEKRHRAECESGWEAEVRLDYDAIRHLHGLAPTKNDLGDVETEPERVDSRYERLLAEEGRLKTEMMGEQQRRIGEVLKKEQGLLDARSGRSERAKLRHLRSQRANLEGSEAA